MATPHLQSELAQLLIFVSKVSHSIRTNTAFNSSTFGDRQAQFDAVYLSDTLHRTHRLGRAIIELPPVQIGAVCDDFIRSLRITARRMVLAPKVARPKVLHATTPISA